MTPKNEKTPQGAPRSPATSNEISWTLLLLALCLALNAWFSTLTPDPQDTAKVVPTSSGAPTVKIAEPQIVVPAAAGPDRSPAQRPERAEPTGRAGSGRNAESGSLPGF